VFLLINIFYDFVLNKYNGDDSPQRGSPSCIGQMGNDERFLVGNRDIIQTVLNSVWLLSRCSVVGYIYPVRETDIQSRLDCITQWC
jgi:hypothetical protein